MLRHIKVIVRSLKWGKSTCSTQIVSACSILFVWSISTPLLIFYHQVRIIALLVTLNDGLGITSNWSIFIWMNHQFTGISGIIYQVLEFSLILKEWLVVLRDWRLIDSLLGLSNEGFSGSFIRFTVRSIRLFSVVFVRSPLHLIQYPFTLFISNGRLALPW